MFEVDEIRVFINYTHDNDEHKVRILELADSLVKEGVDVEIDQYHEFGPMQGWNRWMLDSVAGAKFVLIVSSEANYRRLRGHEKEGTGLGATYEGHLILNEIANAGANLDKFIPVGFAKHSHNMKNIPDPMRDHNYYDLSDPTQYDSLYFHLTGQKSVTKPDLGPRRKRTSSREPESSEGSSPEGRNQKRNQDQLKISSSGPRLGGLFAGSGEVIQDVPPTSSQRAKSALALLIQCPSGLPLSVLSSAVGSSQEDMEEILRGEIGAGEIIIDGHQWSVGPGLNTHSDFFPKSHLPIVLQALLGYVDYHRSATLSRKQVFTVAELARRCRQEAPDLVSTVFYQMNSHLKRTGNKDLVWEMARLSIDAARSGQGPKSDETVQGEVIALVCGLCWVHQREGEILKARAFAEESLKLGRYIPWPRNDAFCKKCLGRILRLEALEARNASRREELFQMSEDSLKEAIHNFSQLSDKDKEEEIGDCFSLLGRTYLESRQMEKALEAILTANGILSDNGNKDYLDLQILMGDYYARLDDWEAAKAFYNKVINEKYDNDYEKSGMRARALIQRSYVLWKNGEIGSALRDAADAEKMWEVLNDQRGIAEARWSQHVIRGDVPSLIIERLRQEDVLVRVNAIEVYKENLEGSPQEVIARRAKPTDMEINRLISVAQNHVVRATNRRI